MSIKFKKAPPGTFNTSFLVVLKHCQQKPNLQLHVVNQATFHGDPYVQGDKFGVTAWNKRRCRCPRWSNILASLPSCTPYVYLDDATSWKFPALSPFQYKHLPNPVTSCWGVIDNHLICTLYFSPPALFVQLVTPKGKRKTVPKRGFAFRTVFGGLVVNFTGKALEGRRGGKTGGRDKNFPSATSSGDKANLPLRTAAL